MKNRDSMVNQWVEFGTLFFRQRVTNAGLMLDEDYHFTVSLSTSSHLLLPISFKGYPLANKHSLAIENCHL